MSSFLKYFYCNMVATRVLSLESTCYNCLANIVELKVSRSRKPIPPSNLNTFSWFQISQWVLPFSILKFHQNLTTIAKISRHKRFGNWKMLIVYTGIDCRSALMRISWPACERNRFFQLWIRCQTFSFNPLKVLYFEWPTRAGRPKYLL